MFPIASFAAPRASYFVDGSRSVSEMVNEVPGVQLIVSMSVSQLLVRAMRNSTVPHAGTSVLNAIFTPADVTVESTRVESVGPEGGGELAGVGDGVGVGDPAAVAPP